MFGVLRVAAQKGCVNSQISLLRQIVGPLRLGQNNQACQQLRQMSDKRVMNIQPSRFEWQKFKDHMHFYIMLGVIPLTIVTTWANIFIGNAELSEIPEGYEPKHWEYYKHPVSRFISKHLHSHPAKQYEINLHYINEEQKKAQMRKLEKKVKQLMHERGDYKGWYYMPYNHERIYDSYEDRQNLGSQGTN